MSNCPGKNAVAVAELTFGLMLSLDRRMADGVADLRAGKWNKKAFSKAHGLLGSTLGLIGFGNIGYEVAKRALAFGLDVVVWSRRLASGTEFTDLAVTIAASPDEVARHSDIVSLHLALNAQTRGFIGEPFFAAMKPGAMFINTARAELVDYAALERAVEALSERMAHDPHLSAALHEVVSAVTSVRSTAAILAESEEIAPDWRERFHRNIYDDSIRLSEAADALVAYLDASQESETGLGSPQEEVEAWLARTGYHIAGLERPHPTPVEALVTGVPELATDAARRLARTLTLS